MRPGAWEQVFWGGAMGLIGVLVWACACLCGGCDGSDGASPQPEKPASVAGVDPSSLSTPLGVARALGAWHREGQYRLLEQYVAAEQRVLLIDTLMAFDRLFVANDRARRRILAMHNEMVTPEFDLSGLGDHMGLFSRDVDFRGERIDGDRAVIAAQVAERVPLDEFEFVRRGGRWVYAPQAPIPSFAELVREVAIGAEHFANQLDGPRLSVKQIRSEFRHRVLRRLRQIQSALTAPRPGAASKPTSKPA